MIETALQLTDLRPLSLQEPAPPWPSAQGAAHGARRQEEDC